MPLVVATYPEAAIPRLMESSMGCDAHTSPHLAAFRLTRRQAATAPRASYTIGRDAAVIVRLARLAPDRFLDRILRRNLKPHYSPD